MAETKDYNPKTASVTDVYMVDDDGHDRWFIPSLAPEASMAKQLAQCQALSPHGEGRDEDPDDPLVLTKGGYVTGNLMMGQTCVGHTATVSGGAKPYVYKMQRQFALTSDQAASWTDIGANITTETGQITWDNTQNDGGRYWRIMSVITDDDGAFITNLGDTLGPVQAVNAQMYGPDPSTESLASGSVTRPKWNGFGEYNLSFSMEIADEASSFTALPVNIDHAETINGMYPNAGLANLKWEVTSPGWIQLIVSRSPIASGTQTFRFRGIVTDTYQSTSDEAYVDFTLNLVP